MKQNRFLLIHKRFWFVIAAVLLCSQFAFAETEPVVAIRCGQLLDPVSGNLTSHAVIVIQGERITRIDSSVPAGAREIDLSAYTVLPGLIDSHTHILLQPEDEG